MRDRRLRREENRHRRELEEALESADAMHLILVRCPSCGHQGKVLYPVVGFEDWLCPGCGRCWRLSERFTLREAR